MDSTSITIIVIVVLIALICIVAFLVFRSRAKVKIQAPFGTSLELDAQQDTPPSPEQEQVMRTSKYGEQEMSSQGGKQKQEMENSSHGKQKMN